MHPLDYNPSDELLRLGYRISSQHDWPLDKTIQLLAQTGYHSVELSLNHPDLDPAALLEGRLQDLQATLEDHNLLVSAMSYRCADKQDFPQTLEALKKGMEVALSLGTKLLLICTAAQSSDPSGRQTTKLLTDLLHQAQDMGLTIGIGPEPDTVIHGIYEFSQLANKLTGLPLGLDLNISHCACTEGNVDEVIAEWASFIVSAHISDAERNRHHHLIPGEGHLDINRAVQALRRHHYNGDLTLDLETNGTAFEEIAVHTMQNCRQLFC